MVVSLNTKPQTVTLNFDYEDLVTSPVQLARFVDRARFTITSSCSTTFLWRSQVLARVKFITDRITLRTDVFLFSKERRGTDVAAAFAGLRHRAPTGRPEPQRNGRLGAAAAGPRLVPPARSGHSRYGHVGHHQHHHLLSLPYALVVLCCVFFCSRDLKWADFSVNLQSMVSSAISFIKIARHFNLYVPCPYSGLETENETCILLFFDWMNCSVKYCY